jgi:hypothetical protein
LSFLKWSGSTHDTSDSSKEYDKYD